MRSLKRARLPCDTEGGGGLGEGDVGFREWPADLLRCVWRVNHREGVWADNDICRDRACVASFV